MRRASVSRTPLRHAACLILGLASALTVHAQALPKAGDFPSQPLHMVSPFPPGGGNDFHMRLVSNELAAVTGWPALPCMKARLCRATSSAAVPSRPLAVCAW